MIGRRWWFPGLIQILLSYLARSNGQKTKWWRSDGPECCRWWSRLPKHDLRPDFLDQARSNGQNLIRPDLSWSASDFDDFWIVGFLLNGWILLYLSEMYQSYFNSNFIQILMITKAISPTLPRSKLSSPPSSIKRTPGLQKSISPIKVKLWYRAKPGYGLKAASKQRVPRRRAKLLHHLSANVDPRSEIRLFYFFLILCI